MGLPRVDLVGRLMRDRRISRPADEFDHGGASLTDAWAEQASAWASWARTPGHDYYYEQYNAPAFLDFVPAPAGLTLDVGCGEGRLGRALRARGHRVVGVDATEMLARLAYEADRATPVARADAAAVPIRDGVADLVVCFMVLQDVDDLDGAAHELARVVAPDGVICAAIVHPIASSGFFAPDDPNHTFLMGRYASVMRHALPVARGVPLTFHSAHRPLERYSEAFEAAGLVIETIREPTASAAAVEAAPPLIANRFVPNFLHFRLRRA